MPTLTVAESLWSELESTARRRQLSAQKLADLALREYLRRVADEELLASSERAARRAPLAASQSEGAVRRHRTAKRSPAP